VSNPIRAQFLTFALVVNLTIVCMAATAFLLRAAHELKNDDREAYALSRSAMLKMQTNQMDMNEISRQISSLHSDVYATLEVQRKINRVKPSVADQEASLRKIQEQLQQVMAMNVSALRDLDAALKAREKKPTPP